MSVQVVTQESFESFISIPGMVIVDFWAAWCPPCRGFKPIFEAASEQHPDVLFGSVNTEEQPELAGSLQVSSIPTVMVFRDGILLFAEPGALNGQQLTQLLTQIQAVDMDKVRAEFEDADESAA